MVYSNQLCPLCQKEGIEHRYTYKGNSWSEWLHQSNDGYLTLCGTAKRFKCTLTDLFDDNSSFYREMDNTDPLTLLAQEKVRRRIYWQNRQLPPRYRYTSTACSSYTAAATPVGDKK
jgi:hypothetical protein